MDNLSKEYIIDFFTNKLMLFGNTPSAVGWSVSGQKLRYEWILKLLPLQGRSILDFGCGKGDFCGFLKKNGLNVKYTGIDINTDLINMASANHPEAWFSVLDIDREPIPDSYDFIISCGVFNLNIQGVKESAMTSMRKLFSHTRKTLLFNCLSSHSATRDINLFYFEFSDILSASLDITKSVRMLPNLIEGDIFMLLNKTPRQTAT